MNDDLVKLCKRLSKHAHAQLSSADLERIANRIEELEAENAKLKQMWWDAGDVTDLAGTIADLEAKLATARRDALEGAAEVAIRMEREMGIQDECGYEPFYTPEDVAHRIRALIVQEEPTT